MNINEAQEEFIISRQVTCKSENTLKFYEWTLGKILDWMKANEKVQEVQDIKEQQINRYLAHMRGNDKKDDYIHSHARVIRAFLNYFVEQEVISPVKFKMPPKGNGHLTALKPEQIKKIANACYTEQERCVIYVLLDTGLRITELRNIKWEDVDIKEKSIKIHKGKGDKYRVVAFGPKTAQKLLRFRYSSELAEDDDYVFQAKGKGTLFTVSGMRSFLLRIREKSGVDFSAHDFRRTFAHLATKEGLSTAIVSQLMGHSSLEVTQRYIGRFDDNELPQLYQNHSVVSKYIK